MRCEHVEMIVERIPTSRKKKRDMGHPLWESCVQTSREFGDRRVECTPRDVPWFLMEGDWPSFVTARTRLPHFPRFSEEPGVSEASGGTMDPDILCIGHLLLRRLLMKRVKGKVVVGLVALILSMSTLALAQTSNPVKASTQDSSSSTTGAMKSNKATPAKTDAASAAAASNPGSSHPADAPPPTGATPLIAPQGWVPQNAPSQPGYAQQPTPTPRQKTAPSEPQPHTKTTKPGSTSTPKN